MATYDKSVGLPRLSRSFETYRFKTSSGSGTQNDTGMVAQPNSIVHSTTVFGKTTPDYASRLARHLQLPPLSYSYTRVKNSGSYYVGLYRQEADFGSYFLTYWRSGNSKIANPDYLYEGSPGEFNAQDGRAVTKVREKIKNQKINLGQIVGERHQVIRLVGDTATRIGQAIVSLKRGSITGAARALGCAVPGRYARTRIRNGTKYQASGTAAPDFVSRAWLELQYGWKPLLTDVYGAAEFMAERNTRFRPHRATATVTKEYRSQKEIKGNTRDLYAAELVRKVKYTVYFNSDPGTTPYVKSGLTNPALVAWELLPWSFVIDWFLPVGSWISSWDATVGSIFVSGTKTVSLKTTAITNRISTGYASEYYNSQKIKTTFNLERYVLLEFPGPQLPAFKNPLSTGHALNALALLTQLIRK